MKEIIKPFHFADKLQKILVVTYPKKKRTSDNLVILHEEL